MARMPAIWSGYSVPLRHPGSSAVRPAFADWARPNEIELPQIERWTHGVALDKPKRISRLPLEIEADHVEAGAMQSHGCTTSAAE